MFEFKAKSFIGLDEELNGSCLSNIDTFTDPISKILTKYDLHKVKCISDEDALFLKNRFSFKSPFCKWLVSVYLLYSKKTYSASEVTKCCLEYVEFMFKSFEYDEKVNSSIFLFEYLLPITIKKVPNCQKSVGNFIFSKLKNANIRPISKLWVMNSICSKKLLLNIFSSSQWKELIKELIVKSPFEKNEIGAVYRCLDIFLKQLSSARIVDREFMIRLISNFILSHINDFSEDFVHSNFRLIRDYLDGLGCYSDETYSLIDARLDEANSSVRKKLQSIVITLEEEEQKSLNEASNKIQEYFKNSDESGKINYLFSSIIPFDKNKIKKEIKTAAEKDPLPNFVNEEYLDEKGAVINYKELNCEERFSLDATMLIRTRMGLDVALYYRNFIKFFVLNEKAKKYIEDLLSNSSIIDDEEDLEDTKGAVFNFFSKKYKESIREIIILLEKNLRKYLKKKGLNIYKRNGSQDFIDLNYIFNNKQKNSFRDCILQTIDDDYYFTLKWLLTDKYGLNLRNDLMHGLSDNLDLESDCVIYSILQIIKFCLYFRD